MGVNLKGHSSSGYSSSEESLNTNLIDVFIAEDKLWYREHDDRVFEIENLGDIPGKSMHFRKATRADYAGANSLETAIVEALTRAIYSGAIRITGPYACGNHIGLYPSDAAPPLRANMPVPIKLQHGQIVDVMTDYHEVIVAKKVKKKIHMCHIKPEYSPSDRARPSNSHRMYFAGVLPEENNPHQLAGEHYWDKKSQVHLGSSREVKTEKVAVTVLGLTNGLISTLYSDYVDGLLLEYSPGRLHTIATLKPCDPQPVDLHAMRESDLDDRHIKMFSKEQVKVIWRYDTTIWLSDADWVLERCFQDNIMQRAARQFKKPYNWVVRKNDRCQQA